MNSIKRSSLCLLRVRVPVLIMVLCFSSVTVSAQFIGIEGYSTNWFLSQIMKVPIAPFKLGGFGWSPSFSVSNNAPDDFGKMRNGYAQTFANPFKRIGDFGIGLSIEDYSEIGIGYYTSLKYKSHEVAFKGTKLNDRARYISPEIGIRYTPSDIDRRSGITIGAGVSYDWMLKYRGKMHDYGNDAANSGFTASLSLGFCSREVEGLSFSIKAGIPLYNFYNKDFSPDGGITHPFKDVDRQIGHFTFTWLWLFD